MSDHHEALAKASAAMMQMIAQGQSIQAAVIRGAEAAEVEQMRLDGVSIAESYLDHTIKAARAVRAIIEP